MFYAAQLLMAAVAFCMGSKEAVTIEAVRKYPYGNPFEKPFHVWGWLSAALVGLILTLLQTQVKAYVLTPFLSALIYWIVFEIRLNTAVFGRWYYIGTTAATDKFLWRTFGLKAETWAAVLKALALLILNALYLIL